MKDMIPKEFRLWDKAFKEMKYGLFHIAYNGTVFPSADDDRDMIAKIKARYILMQFTGQRDLKKEKIWEKDIIKTSYNDIYDFAYYEGIWDNSMGGWYEFCLALHHKEDGFVDITQGGFCVGYLVQSAAKGCEIIGNTLQNPELDRRKGGR